MLRTRHKVEVIFPDNSVGCIVVDGEEYPMREVRGRLGVAHYFAESEPQKWTRTAVMATDSEFVVDRTSRAEPAYPLVDVSSDEELRKALIHLAAVGVVGTGRWCRRLRIADAERVSWVIAEEPLVVLGRALRPELKSALDVDWAGYLPDERMRLIESVGPSFRAPRTQRSLDDMYAEYVKLHSRLQSVRDRALRLRAMAEHVDMEYGSEGIEADIRQFMDRGAGSTLTDLVQKLYKLEDDIAKRL